MFLRGDGCDTQLCIRAKGQVFVHVHFPTSMKVRPVGLIKQSNENQSRLVIVPNVLDLPTTTTTTTSRPNKTQLFFHVLDKGQIMQLVAVVVVVLETFIANDPSIFSPQEKHLRMQYYLRDSRQKKNVRRVVLPRDLESRLVLLLFNGEKIYLFSSCNGDLATSHGSLWILLNKHEIPWDLTT